MALWNSIKMAFKSLKTSKMRTFLTMLGVIIGVTTVALLTTVANGATQTIINSLSKESRLVTLMTQNANNPFNLEKLDDLVTTIEAEESTGEFIYTAVAENNIAVDRASHVVDVTVNMFGKDTTYTMRVGATVRGVNHNFMNVRNIEIDGQFASSHDECVIDREYIDTYLEGKSNSEVIGSKVFIGGRISTYTYAFSSSVEADLAEFHTALREMCRRYNLVTPAEPNASNTTFENGVYTYIESIDPIDYYDCASLEVEVRKNLDEREYEFASDYGIEITDYFEGGREYTVVGVIVEEDSSMMGSGNATSGVSGMGSGTLSALSEYSKTKKGNVYVLLTNENADLFGEFTSTDEIALSGAYFLFENEDEIDDSVLNMCMALMNMGYEIFGDCFVIPMNTVTQIMRMTMDILTVMLTVIAAISLIVGGIGIMNIMLVAVSERTREIGIRKAIGAKKSSILMQFLIEALVVSVLGGLIGLLISFIGSIIVGLVMGITLTMPVWVIIMSIVFCVLIGVVFGMYPAVKAARLQPIDALHRD